MNKNEFLKNYRIDDLQIKGLKILQDPNEFCFGIDAILLSYFASAEIKQSDMVMDMCTGSAVIPLLLWGKTKPKRIVGVEIQEKIARMANESIRLNDLTGDIQIINADIIKLDKQMYNAFDVLTVNPPYIQVGDGIKSDKLSKSTARHEIFCTLDDVIMMSKKLLKDKGSFFMVHRTQRLAEIIVTMKEYNVEPKVIQFVYPHKSDKSNLVLIKGVKGGKPWIDVLEPLIIYNDNNEYTDKIKQIYGNYDTKIKK